MTTEEKLEHFHEICMEDAKEHFRKVVAEYESGLQMAFEEHKADVKRREEMRIGIETEKIKREVKREISVDQINIRREISQKQEELRQRLFQEVAEKLEALRGTEAYLNLLKGEIAEIRAEAGNAPCQIFVDAKDAALLPELPEGVCVSEESFLGGTMAVLPSRNLFIDNTFRSMIADERRSFSFTTGGNDGKQ